MHALPAHSAVFLVAIAICPVWRLDMMTLSCDLHLLRLKLLKQFNGLPNLSTHLAKSSVIFVSPALSQRFQGHRKFVVMQATAQLDIHSLVEKGGSGVRPLECRL